MYYIITYDIGVERINAIRTFLKQYLNWVQNSVFEGELTKAQYIKVRDRLEQLINKEQDNILVYQTRNKRFIQRESLGTIRAETGNII